MKTQRTIFSQNIGLLRARVCVCGRVMHAYNSDTEQNLNINLWNPLTKTY